MSKDVITPFAKPFFAPGTPLDNEAIAKGIKKAEDEWLGHFDKSMGENGGYVAGSYPTLAGTYDECMSAAWDRYL